MKPIGLRDRAEHAAAIFDDRPHLRVVEDRRAGRDQDAEHEVQRDPHRERRALDRDLVNEVGIEPVEQQPVDAIRTAPRRRSTAPPPAAGTGRRTRRSWRRTRRVRVGRSRAYRSMMPPATKIHSTMYTVAAPTMTTGRSVLSMNALRLSSTAPKPRIVGLKVTPSPAAWSLNSCIQS